MLALGLIQPDGLIAARARALSLRVSLRSVLLTEGAVSETEMAKAEARRTQLRLIDLSKNAPSVRLIEKVGLRHCLHYGYVPIRDLGFAMLVAVSDPERFARAKAHVTQHLGSVALAVTSESAVHHAILSSQAWQLMRQAEHRTPGLLASRGWSADAFRKTAALTACLVAPLLVFAPQVFVWALFVWTLVTLTACMGLKLTAAFLFLRPPKGTGHAGNVVHLKGTPPATVSVLVPLLGEETVAQSLIQGLRRLDYPKECLDVCLVVEETDIATQRALGKTALPTWMRIVTVPAGTLRTKPRALNYALDFCKGDIVGIWDAEDRPERDQIKKVVDHFSQAGPEVACLQGRLDYFNPTTNWLSRCFTIEYATWFRIILPGLVRLGLPIPLGGTTLFVRRRVLERLGAWDAHNVTEDADLGLRLYRHGYRTEIVDTLTEEEANCRLWPWIKQRSRWNKGYAMTYAVHMRAPRSLWRDLGPKGFLGVQVVFLATLSQVLLAPLTWAFWPAAFGFWTPFAGTLLAGLLQITALLFVASEVLSWGVNTLAIARTRHRRLWPWVPTLLGYFPFASVAALRAIAELAVQPFHWHKTEHGVFRQSAFGADTRLALEKDSV